MCDLEQFSKAKHILKFRRFLMELILMLPKQWLKFSVPTAILKTLGHTKSGRNFQ